ncbi:NAD-dependent epimerase/dehydratase family protein [Magnetofaba australis]|uniref:Putative NAD-dependent epimerase/dehydratase n=1 Tax=Magnetofaba australis IT-1 TaxID=1434232 RepID=A0A1Y2K7J8_9PROT|nr:NAD-dependent epimerase/dehydratase family protein [Magnetofaba australis]OSM05307.1 putative NAD-dependent epimerase/dehydratase [Magnetofaba australis IT-1]
MVELAGKRVLVSGANGFIGRTLCAQLQARGVTVRALLRQPAEGPWDEDALADFDQPEATLIPQLQIACADVAAIFHLAGKAHALDERSQDPEIYDRLNAHSTRLLMAAGADCGVQRLALFSSIKAMGEGGPAALNESAPCDPQTAYGRSKLLAESFALDPAEKVDGVALRLSMVYGGESKGNMARMADAVRRNRFPPLPKVDNARAMIHVADVCAAAILAVEQAPPRSLYILTDGQQYATWRIQDAMVAALGRPALGWRVPYGLLRAIALAGDLLGALLRRRAPLDSDALDKLLGSANYDSGKIRRELGFVPQHTLYSALPELFGEEAGV